MAVRAELFAQETLNGEIMSQLMEAVAVSGFDVNAYPV